MAAQFRPSTVPRRPSRRPPHRDGEDALGWPRASSRGRGSDVATRRASLPPFSRAALVSHADTETGRRQVRPHHLGHEASGVRPEEGRPQRDEEEGYHKTRRPRPRLPAEHRPGLEHRRDRGLQPRRPSQDLRFTPSLLGQASRAEEMVVSEAESFSRWLLASRQSSAHLAGLQVGGGHAQRGGRCALRRLPRLSEKERKVVEAMSKRLVSKLLAPPTTFVKVLEPRAASRPAPRPGPTNLRAGGEVA